MPKVRLITATSIVGREYFLRELSESILSQTFGNWDWTIHAHGVNHAQIKVIRPFLKDSRIRLICTEPRLSIPDARNVAASASGPFELLLNVDDDDLLPRDSLQTHVEAFALHPDAQWSMGAQADVDALGNAYYTYRPDLPYGTVNIHDVVAAWPTPNHQLPIASHLVMFRRDTFRKAGMYGAENTDDIEIALRAAAISDGFNHKHVTYFYRQHAGQTIRSASFKSHKTDFRENMCELAISLAANGVSNPISRTIRTRKKHVPRLASSRGILG